MATELMGRTRAVNSRLETVMKMIRMVVELFLSFLSEQRTSRARMLSRVPMVAITVEATPPSTW